MCITLRSEDVFPLMKVLQANAIAHSLRSYLSAKPCYDLKWLVVHAATSMAAILNLSIASVR